MKILIIASHVGRTAPGIVFERLIKGLSVHYDIDLITSNYSPGIDLSGVNKKTVIPLKYNHPRIQKMFVRLFNMNFIDKVWAKRAKKKCHARYDLIFSFASSYNLYSLLAGVKISTTYKTRHYTYFVDAVPAPNGWIPEDGYFKGLKKIIKKYLSQVDGFFAANPKMLEYQLTTFNHKKDLKTGVIYNPGNNSYTEFSQIGSKGINSFLYTGGIYGLRTPVQVIGAFRQILKEYPNSRLVFVGSHLSETYLKDCTKTEREKILIHPYTSNLTEYYKEAIALFDIDANIDNDIFLSSKITNYIFINRIIISVTGNNSPSREIFCNIPSILQPHHDVQEIVCAMKEAINRYKDIEFADRLEVQKLFSLENVVDAVKNYIAK